MGCRFGFNYTFSDLLATITKALFAGWVMRGCTESINRSLNRPSHARRLPSGNGLQWSDFLVATLGVSGFLRAGEGSYENNLSALESQRQRAPVGFAEHPLLLRLQNLFSD